MIWDYRATVKVKGNDGSVSTHALEGSFHTVGGNDYSEALKSFASVLRDFAGEVVDINLRLEKTL